jgi:hypothetical protein
VLFSGQKAQSFLFTAVRQATKYQQAMTLPQAELLAWQYIEEEFIQVAFSKKEREINHPKLSSMAQQA